MRINDAFFILNQHTRTNVFIMESWNYFSVCFLIICHQLINVYCSIPSQDITVKEGEPVDLTCNYQGNFLSWRYYTNEFDNQGDYIAGGLHVADSFQGQFAVSYNQTLGIYKLHIERPLRTFTGYYKCAYLNTLVSESILRVTPNFYPRCVTYFLGSRESQVGVGKVNDNILLSCNSGFNNNYPKITWLRGRSFTILAGTNQRNILQLPRTLIPEDEDVTFTCVLGEGDLNSAPSCSLTPFPSQPEVSINPLVSNNTEGESAVFKCSGHVKLGNITYDWDNSTLNLFAGRYSLSDDKSLLRVSGLQASDNGTNVTCLVKVDTGTHGGGVAVLLVSKEKERTTNRNLNGGNDGNGKTGAGTGSGGIVTVVVGVISVLVIVVILGTIVIMIIHRKRKSKNHPASESPRLNSEKYEGGVLGNHLSSQYYDDSEQYAVTGPPMVNGASQSQQIAFLSERNRSSEVQVTYAVASQHTFCRDEELEKALTTHDQEDDSKELYQQGEANYVPEYHVIENSDSDAQPVYAEVNKGSTEHNVVENSQHFNGYSQINKQDSALTKLVEETVSETKLTKKPNYAKVNKKVKDTDEKLDDGYAKPDFTVSDENTDEKEEEMPLPSSPLYAEVHKSDGTEDGTDAEKHKSKGNEKPKYAKVNKKLKRQSTSETET